MEQGNKSEMSRSVKYIRGRINKFGKQRDVDLREASRIILSVQANEEKLSGEDFFSELLKLIHIFLLVNAELTDTKAGPISCLEMDCEISLKKTF